MPHRPPHIAYIGVSQILETVAAHTGVTVDELKGRDRRMRIVDARFVAYHMLRREGFSFEEVGVVFARDHGSVINGCRAIDHWIKTYPRFKATLEHIERAVDQQTKPELKVAA